MLVDTQNQVAPQKFGLNSIIYVCKPLMRMMKNAYKFNFDDFQTKKVLIIVLTRCPGTKITELCPDPPGATQFLVSTSVW